MQFTIVTPTGKVEPDAGLQEDVGFGWLSVTVGFGYVTPAEHCPDALFAVRLAGQEIVGGCVSATVTLKLQLEWLFAASVAVQFTAVVPNAN